MTSFDIKDEEDDAKAQYEVYLMKYNIDLEQYAKEAYDKYMNDNGFQYLKDVETVQNLTFQREDGASDIVATSP